MKNEAEAYMLKELSLLKWQEKATKLAHEDTDTKLVEIQANVASLDENLKTGRFMLMTSLKYVCLVETKKYISDEEFDIL